MTLDQMRRLLVCVDAYAKARAVERFNGDGPWAAPRLEREAEEARIALCLAFDVDPDLVPMFSLD